MRKLFKVCLIIAIFIATIPISASAITLGEHEAQLYKYQKDAENNRIATNQTQAQINQANLNIENIKKEMKDLGKEIEELSIQVEKYHDYITEKTAETKQMLEYLQFSNKEDLYLDYVVSAENMTDLIYRAAVVREITAYNNRTINELEKMIDDNKLREKQIDDREDLLVEKEKELGNNLVKLGEKKAGLSDTSVSVAQQIKIYQDIVEGYKKQGCKSNHVIGVDCAVKGDAGIFRRPTQTGYVTSEVGWRGGSLHKGIDIGSKNGRGEKIYPIGNGTIIAKYSDYYGALVVAIEHYSSIKGQWYTSLYAHLSSYAPNLYVGKSVTSDQYIGYMGDTGYAFGIHLHLEIAPCRLFNWGGSCATWDSYYNFIVNQYNKGFKGARSVLTLPNGTYNSWSTR